MAPPAVAVVEIDFLGLGTPVDGRGQPPNQHKNPVVLARRGGCGGGGSGGSSIRDIQKAVSRMDPDVLRTLITAAPEASRMPQMKRSNSSTNINDKNIARAATTIHPLNASSMCRLPIPSASDTQAAAAPPPPHLAPLTIFYDGAVSVFDVPPQVADLIMKTAESSSSLTTSASAISIAETLVGDAPLSGLPLARKKSLRRFLEKRQLRLTSAAPYTAPSPAASSSTAAAGDGEVVLPAPAASSSDDLRSECNMWAMADACRRKQQLPLAVGRNSRTTSSNSNSSSFTAAAIPGAAHATGAR